MASLIPGYQYDIFISYRQKDNHGDHWVTQFVETLKTELESTFKEDISIYFDINPHDGLLETHDVDESLKDKLKCLIFIPVISRTYCDPNSFAWEHEFKAFMEMASKDQFGLKVRLPNGNVVSRVLPVRVHDLDGEDIKECETVLGGFLRGVEFIYKEPGVDKPLLPGDDEKKNLNHTQYRIQIVKVGHAVKEIISGLRNPVQKGKEVSETIKEEKQAAKKFPWLKWVSAAVFLMALVVAGILTGPGLFKQVKTSEKSIAVLPFRNDSPDSTNAYFINGVMEMILDNLAKINDLRVISRTSVEQYRYNRTKTIPQIAHELGVNYIVEGSGQKYGDQIMLTIQLIEAKNDKHLYSEPYHRKWEDIFDLQKEIALAVANRVNAVITPEETKNLGTPTTGNIQALNALMRGDEYHRMAALGNKWELDEQAKKYYLAAIRLDSTYAHAYVQLSWVCSTDSALLLLDKALKINNSNVLALTAKGRRLYQKGLNEEAKTNLKEAIAINPKYTSPYRFLGIISEQEGDFFRAVEYRLKGYLLDDRTNPILTNNNILGLCTVLNNMGLYGEGLIFARKLIEFKNDSTWYHQFRIKLIRDSLGTEAGQRSFRQYYQATSLDVYDMPSMFLIAVEHRETDIAKELFNKYSEKGGPPSPGWPEVGYILKIMGSEKEAASEFEKYINQLTVIQNGVSRASICQVYFYLSYAYSGLGDRKKAMEYFRLFAGCKNTSLLAGNYIKMKYHILFDPIREEPEFKDLLAKSESAHLQTKKEVREVLKKEGFIY